MPTYENRCKSCGFKWEVRQRITEPPVTHCPECGEKSAERLVSGGAAILFRGTGFYCTDYRSESYKKDAENDKKQNDDQ